MTVDVSDDIGKVRLLISDVTPGDYVFADEEVQAFLDLEGDVRLAAALALETQASNEALVFKKIRTDRLMQTDGPAVAESLMARAALLRSQAYQSGEFAIADGGGLLAEMTETPTYELYEWGI